MTREEIVREIIKRFKLDAYSLKNLNGYEYELIYEAFPIIDKSNINKAIDDFSNGKFKIRKNINYKLLKKHPNIDLGCFYCVSHFLKSLLI